MDWKAEHLLVILPMLSSLQQWMGLIERNIFRGNPGFSGLMFLVIFPTKPMSSIFTEIYSRSPQETACLGPLEQQVQLAPDLLSETDESFGTNTPGRVQASWIQGIGVGLRNKHCFFFALFKWKYRNEIVIETDLGSNNLIHFLEQ